ncbi:uncharacterized protein At2g29880-like [Vicia villosa]|uniref:uncharacterized protein At2g29880-like n=1 Tax=Vicia villosa TaxID=3911 RepID=UPI00273BAEDE|nr:uncharacterized protein At2g29880-like [Vicia villosa]
MAKNKGQSVEHRQVSKEILRWTDDMDQILLNALMEEANKGNRHDGAWTTEAYSNVVDALRSLVAPTMTKQHIKNRMKTLKDHFAESYDLFGSLSGFAWNPISRRFEAEDEVWQDLIREKPHAAKWKTMQIRHYDVLKELFGLDRAVGKKSSTNRMRHNQLEKEREKEREKEKDNVDLNDPVDDTYMEDQHTSIFDEVREEPPIVDSYSPPAYGPSSHQSTGTYGSRGTKRKAPMNDFMEAQLDRMTNSIGLVADAMNNGNNISDQLHDVAKQQIEISERQVASIEKRNEILQNSRPRVYTGADVWNMLSELDLLQQFRLKCYEVLCNDNKKKRADFWCAP